MLYAIETGSVEWNFKKKKKTIMWKLEVLILKPKNSYQVQTAFSKKE